MSGEIFYYEVEALNKYKKKEILNSYKPNTKEVRQEIIKEGYIPLKITKKKNNFLNAEFIDSEYKVQFLRALNFHVQAGSSPATALKVVIESEEDHKKRVKMKDSLKILDSGGSFSEALKMLNFFPNSVIAILESGEKSGNIKASLNSATQYMTDKRSGYVALMAAFTWISIDLFFAVSTVWYNQFGYIPQIKEQGIETENQELIERFNFALNLATDLNMALLISSLLISFSSLVGIHVYGRWFKKRYS